jgi:hypothetical protein
VALDRCRLRAGRALAFTRLAWEQIADAEALDRHTRAVRREGFPDYAVHPGGPRDPYTAIVFVEPFSGRNLRAFGFDMFQEPVRRAAMERARDQGRAALSGKVSLEGLGLPVAEGDRTGAPRVDRPGERGQGGDGGHGRIAHGPTPTPQEGREQLSVTAP